MQLLKLALPLFVASLISAAPLPKDHNVGAQDMLKWTVPVDSLPHDLLLGYKGRDVQDESSALERRAIINGVDRTNKKPSFLAKILTKVIKKAAGWKRDQISDEDEVALIHDLLSRDFADTLFTL